MENNDDTRAVKLNDGYGTIIIYIGKNENKEKAIKKYLKKLEESRLSSMTTILPKQKVIIERLN